MSIVECFQLDKDDTKGSKWSPTFTQEIIRSDTDLGGETAIFEVFDLAEFRSKYQILDILDKDSESTSVIAIIPPGISKNSLKEDKNIIKFSISPVTRKK